MEQSPEDAMKAAYRTMLEGLKNLVGTLNIALNGSPLSSSKTSTSLSTAAAAQPVRMTIKSLKDCIGQFERTCSPLERLPVELQKLIMEYVLDFTTKPGPLTVAPGKRIDCFGMSYFGSHSVSLLQPGKALGDRNRFWDNDFFFPRGSIEVLHFFETNVNRRTYIERFTMKNDCFPVVVRSAHDEDMPEDFFQIFRYIAAGKRTHTVPFMIVCDPEDTHSEESLRRYLGIFRFEPAHHNHVSYEAIIHRRPWLGSGSCYSPDQDGLDEFVSSTGEEESEDDDLVDDSISDYGISDSDNPLNRYVRENDSWAQDKWAYIQYDATWADRYKDDLERLRTGDVVGGVYCESWSTSVISSRFA
ncbi:hypothetical protein LTR17_019317 [Elasticomyces elasticus]|nr:hypothetical protein LTR17_019317 [Elasticomyces elasticus]